MKSLRAAAGAALVLALTSCGESDPGTPSAKAPTATPTTSRAAPTPEEPRGLPVWWDEGGLHHDGDVEKAAVPLGKPFRQHLALVRSGALYRDQRNGAIWFHPWNDEPRKVGHGSAAGPGGDPEGDTAAWFDGKDLVVYDTARDEVVSRTREAVVVSPNAEYVEHVGHGNGWVYVSATQVVWRYADVEGSHGLARRDLVAGSSEIRWNPRPLSGTDAQFEDVSATSAVWSVGRTYDGEGYFLFDREGAPRTGRAKDLEGAGRLSPDGSWLLTAELADGTHGVAITDLRTGSTWKPFARVTYAFFSWAYGDVVVMRTNGQARDPKWSLTSCSVSERSCETLEHQGEVVLPNP